ncbi:alpha-tectorin-like [Tubulanus polymorphus]|uniref:alpha-tectorin-like n=1 Tax=Tubulanus polymorphus TaxID=672921 RepID=UPI003DA28561
MVWGECGISYYWDASFDGVGDLRMTCSRYMNKVEGMCGNMDNNPSNDFQGHTNDAAIGSYISQHFMIQDDTALQKYPGCKVGHPAPVPTEPAKPFCKSQATLSTLDKICGAITRQFGQCYQTKKGELEDFKKDCIFDGCLAEAQVQSMKRDACSKVADAVQFCSESNFHLTVNIAECAAIGISLAIVINPGNNPPAKTSAQVVNGDKQTHNTPMALPPVAFSDQGSCVCDIEGDPHYITYDEVEIDFQGICKYTLSKSLLKNDHCAFNIEGKNEHRPDLVGDGVEVSFLRMLDIQMFNQKIRFLQDQKFEINGKSHGVSKTYSDPAGNFVIKPTGDDIVFDAMGKCKLYVKWDGMFQAKIRVDKGRYSGHMSGLCGNCNANKNDDWLLADLHTNVKGQPDADIKVGDSFKVHDDTATAKQNCAVVKTKVNTECKNKGFAKLIKGSSLCGIISNTRGHLAACASSKKLDATIYEKDCYFDACAVQAKGMQSMMRVACEAIKTFVEDCEGRGVSLTTNWRNQQLCKETCPANSVYRVEESGCVATCADPHAIAANCDMVHTQGCECKSGFVYHNHACIPVSQCPKSG